MNNPLAELKDIHVPTSLGWWPPAYGWWLLAFTLLGLIVLLGVLLVKRHQRNLARRQALETVLTISGDTNHWPLELNSLLKRLVQTYQPNLAVQSLFGDPWLNFLTQALPTTKQATFKQKMQIFQHALYQAQPASQLDFIEYKILVTDWIKNAKLSGKPSQQHFSQWVEQHNTQGGSHV
jgi:hypothetical protein